MRGLCHDGIYACRVNSWVKEVDGLLSINWLE